MIEILLIFCIIICLSLIGMIKLKFEKLNVSNIMSVMFFMLTVWCLGLLGQSIFIKLNSTGNPIYFDYITYIGICFTPPIALIMSIKYWGAKINNLKIFCLSIIPILSLIILWTNDYHNLFYKHYSVNFSEAIYGPMFYVNSGYSYILMVLFIIIMIKASIKKSGFFSIQTALIVIGSLIPLIVNIMGTLRIINISIYVTPMLFVITLIFYAIAIIKYKILNITPVALKTITNTMSDSFVVVSTDGSIVDMNRSFKENFNELLENNKVENLFLFLKEHNKDTFDKLKNAISLSIEKNEKIILEYTLKVKDKDKYFEVDIQPIKSNTGNEYIGTLLLFKDITQHKLDMVELEEKQNIIVKQGQLVSIGELAGGVAHDINTPIAAIKTGIVMLSSMTSERTDQEKEIIFRMDNCANKIITIVNSMRNQIRNLGGDTDVDFKISSVLKDIKIITYNEISKNRSDVVIDIKDDVSIKGDPTKLGQVFTNLVVNAAQAYGEDNGGKIIISVEEDSDGKNALVKVIDFAGGIDVKISPFVFKNILTTKGIKGTGLGLYLVYSVIVGSFKGDISFDSSLGNGTTFFIKIPKSSEKEENQITVESKTGVEVDDVGEVINKDENKEQKINNENNEPEN